jgi:hypothetical protein
MAKSKKKECEENTGDERPDLSLVQSGAGKTAWHYVALQY